MLSYLAKRLAGFVPLLLGISFVSFMVMALAPGSPVDLMTDLNPKASPEARVQLEKYYGLDKPIYVQYGLWLGRIVQGDLGTSFSRDRRPVLDKILEALPITLLLNVLDLVLILAAGDSDRDLFGGAAVLARRPHHDGASCSWASRCRASGSRCSR